MENADSSVPNYILGHDLKANERLLIQGRLINPITRRVFNEAGITAGMRVLDIGCGPGDVSLIAADLVGPTGHVLGLDGDMSVIDIARSRVRERGLTHVEFAQRDILATPLEESYDAIVGRFILMHLPDPSGVLREFATHVRPAGVMLFQDYAAVAVMGTGADNFLENLSACRRRNAHGPEAPQRVPSGRIAGSGAAL
jgi:ubiquinone/menaquinone biosynthesis C-methylase UbiE